MEGCIIVTYRCNAKCSMCDTWKFPTSSHDEIKPQIYEKLPDSLKFLNITGGEPLLREDLPDIARIAVKKSKRVVISTNGYYTDKIISLAREFPGLGFRISIEGLPTANDQLRGLKNGFDRGLRTLLRLKAMGLNDIGFGITVSDVNANDMLELYHLADAMNVEFATASTHNSFYFHKSDNKFIDQEAVAREFEKISDRMLKTKKIKNWFRAYFNFGMANYIRGGERLLPCEVGTEMFFVDPYGRVLPCNGSDEEMVMGDLKKESFNEIWNGREAERVRTCVAECQKNCWMIGSVAPAMRKNILRPIFWILRQKMKIH